MSQGGTKRARERRELIQGLEKLHLGPGDVLVLRLPDHLYGSDEARQFMQAASAITRRPCFMLREGEELTAEKLPPAAPPALKVEVPRTPILLPTGVRLGGEHGRNP